MLDGSVVFGELLDLARDCLERVGNLLKFELSLGQFFVVKQRVSKVLGADSYALLLNLAEAFWYDIVPVNVASA